MKQSFFVLFVALIVFSVLSSNSFSQWEPDVRLTSDSAASFTSDNNARCVASEGSNVHIVWYDERDPGYEIYYKRSSNGGVDWGSDTRLSNLGSISWRPSLAVSSTGVVHVVWEDGRDGNHEIYYKLSLDGGLTWTADTRLTNDIGFSQRPSVTVSATGVVHLVWMDDRHGNMEIYYKRSTDGGLNWEADTRLTNNSASSEYPSVAVSPSGVVHVAWYGSRDGNNEIYYKNSTDGGLTWSADARMTNHTDESNRPSIAVSGTVVHLLWYDSRDQRGIYYKRSTDDGFSWPIEDTRLASFFGSNTAYPSVSVSGAIVHIVWRDARDGNYEIYYKRSTDGGLNWEADTRLTNYTGGSEKASIAISGNVVHLVWTDFRDGNSEIYYKRNLTGNVVAVKPVSYEMPNAFSLAQNYPNPFNPSTTITFQLPRSNFLTLKVYNFLGQEVATLVNDVLPPGTYEVQWNAKDLSSGVYFYRLQAGSFSETKKLILHR